MCSVAKTFIEMCLGGDVDLNDIDDYVEKWHQSNQQIKLSSFLGMTEEEYALWVEKPNSLRYILFARQYDESINETIIRMTVPALAARAENADDIKEVFEWLRTTGRI